MQQIEKTVFISYRRTNAPWALTVYQDLTHHGYDVFLDYEGIGPGDFESVILANITSRAHFLIVLTPSALERCAEPGDWLRREIEAAIENERNIIPLMLEGFSFDSPAIASQLTGGLAHLKNYNGLSMPAEYFLAAMEKLRTKFLNVPLAAILQPASRLAQRAATEQKAAADAAPPVREQELTAQHYFEQGVASSDPDEEIRLNTEAIRIKPDYADAFHNRGNARQDKGDLEGALEDYNQAIRLKPDYADAFYNRGLARDEGDPDGALEDFDQAIRLNPDNPEFFDLRGGARKAKGDLDGALEDYSQVIQLNPDYLDAFLTRGRVREEKGDLDGALEDYSEAIRLDPHNTVALYCRGTLFDLLDRHAAAIADLQQYLEWGGGEQDGDTEEVEQMIRDLEEKL